MLLHISSEIVDLEDRFSLFVPFYGIIRRNKAASIFQARLCHELNNKNKIIERNVETDADYNSWLLSSLRKVSIRVLLKYQTWISSEIPPRFFRCFGDSFDFFPMNCFRNFSNDSSLIYFKKFNADYLRISCMNFTRNLFMNFYRNFFQDCSRIFFKKRFTKPSNDSFRNF